MSKKKEDSFAIADFISLIAILILIFIILKYVLHLF